MTSDHGRKRTVQDVYDLLAAEFTNAARREARVPNRFRGRPLLVVPLVALALGGGTTAALAITGELSGHTATIEGPNGEKGTVTAIEATPATMFAPGNKYADCPVSVRDSLYQIDRLSDYASASSYPVAGCPTIGVLKQYMQDNSDYLRALNATRREHGKPDLDPNSP